MAHAFYDERQNVLYKRSTNILTGWLLIIISNAQPYKFKFSEKNNLNYDLFQHFQESYVLLYSQYIILVCGGDKLY